MTSKPTPSRDADPRGNRQTRQTYTANLGKSLLEVASVNFVAETRDVEVVSRVETSSLTTAVIHFGYKSKERKKEDRLFIEWG